MRAVAAQETAQLQADVMKLSRKLAGGDLSKLKEGEIMREVLMTSERMATEKNKVPDACAPAACVCCCSQRGEAAES